jgi:hypothetical protein
MLYVSPGAFRQALSKSSSLLATHSERCRGLTCDAKGMALRATAWAPRLSTCDEQLPRATAWPPRPSTCVAPRASAWAPPPLVTAHSVCAWSPCFLLFNKRDSHQHTFPFASGAQNSIPKFLKKDKGLVLVSPPLPTRRDCVYKGPQATPAPLAPPERLSPWQDVGAAMPQSHFLYGDCSARHRADF